MPEPFDVRRHVVELQTVRYLMVERCRRIVEVGGDDAHSQAHVRSLDAVLALLYGKCSVPGLHSHLSTLLASGKDTIRNSDLLRLMTSNDAP